MFAAISFPLYGQYYGPEKTGGGYRQCKTYISIQKNGSTDSSVKVLIDVKKFNEKGYLIECYSNDYSRGRKGKYIYKYEVTGNLTEYGYCINDSSFEILDSYIYSSTGNLIESVSYNFDGSIKSKKIHKYDKNGQRIETELSGNSESGNSTISYRYNDKDSLIEEAYACSNNSVQKRKQFKYNEQGLRNEFIEYRGNKMLKFISCQYDSRGNKIEEVIHNPDSSVMIRKEMKYNDDGKTKEMILYNFNNIPVNQVSYKYDKYGNPTEEVIIDHLYKQTKTIEYIYSN